MKKVIALCTALFTTFAAAVPALAADSSSGSQAGSPILYICGIILIILAVLIHQRRKK